MTYKGYMARIEFDPRDNIFFGKVMGIEDSITFHGDTVEDLIVAKASGKSLNQWAVEVLDKATHINLLDK